MISYIKSRKRTIKNYVKDVDLSDINISRKNLKIKNNDLNFFTSDLIQRDKRISISILCNI